MWNAACRRRDGGMPPAGCRTGFTDADLGTIRRGFRKRGALAALSSPIRKVWLVPLWAAALLTEPGDFLRFRFPSRILRRHLVLTGGRLPGWRGAARAARVTRRMKVGGQALEHKGTRAKRRLPRLRHRNATAVSSPTHLRRRGAARAAMSTSGERGPPSGGPTIWG